MAGLTEISKMIEIITDTMTEISEIITDTMSEISEIMTGMTDILTGMSEK